MRVMVRQDCRSKSQLAKFQDQLRIVWPLVAVDLHMRLQLDNYGCSCRKTKQQLLGIYSHGTNWHSRGGKEGQARSALQLANRLWNQSTIEQKPP